MSYTILYWTFFSDRWKFEIQVKIPNLAELHGPTKIPIFLPHLTLEKLLNQIYK